MKNLNLNKLPSFKFSCPKVILILPFIQQITIDIVGPKRGQGKHVFVRMCKESQIEEAKSF